jgi:hypothetical protein
MKLSPVIDSDVPVPLGYPKSPQQREAIYEAAQTVIAMSELEGTDLTTYTSDQQVDEARARYLFNEDPINPAPTPADLRRPALVLKLEAMLSKYDELVIKDADKIRRYITGKLIIESEETKHAGHRLKALELLGKISTVGLFTDRTEITIEHRGTEELEALLRSKLDALVIEGHAERV